MFRQMLGQRLSSRRHNDHVAWLQSGILERRQDGVLAALDHPHGHVGQAAEHAGDGGIADQGRVLADFDLGDELAAVAGKPARHGRAVRQQARQDKQHVDQADAGQDQSRHDEIEKPDRRQPQFAGDAGDQQIGR
jgi:hypothetical protein